VVSTPLKNISQIESFPQVGVNIKNILKPPPSFVHHFGVPQIIEFLRDSESATALWLQWCLQPMVVCFFRPSKVTLGGVERMFFSMEIRSETHQISI